MMTNKNTRDLSLPSPTPFPAVVEVRDDEYIFDCTEYDVELDSVVFDERHGFWRLPQ